MCPPLREVYPIRTNMCVSHIRVCLFARVDIYIYICVSPVYVSRESRESRGISYTYMYICLPLRKSNSIETFLEEINGINLDIQKEEEDAATELPSLLKLLSKKITLSGNSSLTRKWWYEVMTSRPPPLPKNSELLRESILDRVEEGWQEEDWVTTMPKLICTLLQENPTSTRNLPPDRVSHAAKGVQWVRMEQLGKALTNRCRAVRELPYKKTKETEGDQRQSHQQ